MHSVDLQNATAQVTAEHQLTNYHQQQQKQHKINKNIFNNQKSLYDIYAGQKPVLASTD